MLTRGLLALPLGLAVAASTAAGGEVAVELVVDASVSMERELPGGQSRLGAVRDGLAAVIAALPGDGDGIAVGLRVVGGDLPWSDPAACADSRLLAPVGAVDRAALLGALGGIRPGGGDGVAPALTAAAGDLAGHPGRRLALLLTDGEVGACPGDGEAAAAALEAAGVELLVVGRGLDPRRVGRLAQVARLEPGGGASGVAAAVGRLLDGAVELGERRQDVVVRPSRGGAPVAGVAGVLVAQSDERTPLEARDGALVGAAAPGSYRLEVTEGEGGSWLVSGLAVLAGVPFELALDLPAPGEVVLTPAERGVVAGDWVDLALSRPLGPGLGDGGAADRAGRGAGRLGGGRVRRARRPTADPAGGGELRGSALPRAARGRRAAGG